MKAIDFGPDFKWGVSSSSFQTEGAYQTDDKGISIWDLFSGVPGKINGNKKAHISCDFYNRYIQDLILMNYMNIKNFRFSISWPRIFPEGFGKVNEKGLDFYDRLIDYSLEMDIDPWVTLYHWDLPQALEDKGGWTNRSVIHWFSKYVETCIKKFGDRVQNWMILNEPLVFTGAGYFLGIHAPGKKGMSPFLQAVHHAVLCQSMGGRIAKSWNGKLNIGTTFSTSHIEPLSKHILNVNAAEKVDALVNRLFLEPLLGLGYPTRDLPFLNTIEKYVQPGDEQLMVFPMDFIGVQNYTREIVRHTSFVPYINARIVKAEKRNVPKTAMQWEIYPKAMYHILKKYATYPQIKNLIVTENGAAFNDELENDKVNDLARINFLKSYLAEVKKAKQEGAPVRGYFVWCFTDNFEWTEGLSKRFGLVHVDFATQKRTIKASGGWYRNFLTTAKMSEAQKMTG